MSEGRATVQRWTDRNRARPFGSGGNVRQSACREVATMLNTTITKIALTIAVAVGGVGFMVSSSIGTAQHYKMVYELMAGVLAQWQGKELKVHGWVEAGTIVEKS